MNILLERYGYLPSSTLGSFSIGEETFYTVEQPYNNNAPFISCVPDGIYKLVPHETEKKSVPKGKCYALVNPDLDVYHLPEERPKEKPQARYACLFTHIANYARNVEGCIGSGSKLGRYDTIYDSETKVWVNGVSSSRFAVIRVLELIGLDRKDLTITIVPTKGAVYLRD